MPARQRGVALLTAMLIMAITAIITTNMVADMNIALHRSGNIWNSQQAWWYGVGIENWVGAKLKLDAEHSKIDSLEEAWAQDVDYLPIDGGSISGRVLDLQGRYNLNNLVLGDSKKQLKQFQRLIIQITDTDAVTAETIADSTKDWLDDDTQPTLPSGAEDNYYLGLKPAYRTANTLMISPSELRQVRGVTPQIYNALLPYISTLPTSTPINVNTAPAPVLQSMAENLPNNTGKQLLAIRDDDEWKSVDAFLQSDPLAGQDLKATQLSVTTDYFLIAGTITIGPSRTQFYSVLERANNGVTQVVRHSIGAY